LVEIADPVFLYPVYPLCGSVSKIAAVEVAAEEKDEFDTLAVGLAYSPLLPSSPLSATLTRSMNA
jgi:hypothetical protein